MMSKCLTRFPIIWFRKTQVIPEYVVFYNNVGILLGSMMWKGNSQGRKRKDSKNLPANPILTNFTYSESLSILPLSES